MLLKIYFPQQLQYHYEALLYFETEIYRNLYQFFLYLKWFKNCTCFLSFCLCSFLRSPYRIDDSSSSWCHTPRCLRQLHNPRKLQCQGKRLEQSAFLGKSRNLVPRSHLDHSHLQSRQLLQFLIEHKNCLKGMITHEKYFNFKDVGWHEQYLQILAN